MWGKMPFDLSAIECAENVVCGPNLLEAGYQLLPLLLIAFVSVKLFISFHSTIYCVPPGLPKGSPYMELFLLEGKCHPLTPDSPQ